MTRRLRLGAASLRLGAARPARRKSGCRTLRFRSVPQAPISLQCDSRLALHLACAADRAWRQGTGVLHIRETLGPRARACAFDAACVCACVSLHSLRKERGEPGRRQRGTYSSIGKRPATESAALLRMHAAATRVCVVRTPAPARYAPMFACLVARVALQAACDERAQFCAAATAHGTCRVEPLDSQCVESGAG